MTREFHSSRPRLARRLARWALVATLATVGPGATTAHAAQASFALDFGNAYVWRGIVFNDSGIAQFSLDAGSPVIAGTVPINFNVWGNYDIGDFDGTLEQTEFSEIDLTISAGLPYGFEIGFIEYQFPVTTGSTRELYVGWSKEMTLTPTVLFYYDVGAVDSFYTSLDLSHSIPVGNKTSIGLSGLVGLAGKRFAEVNGGEKGGFFNYSLSAALSHQINDTIGLRGTLGYSGSLDKAVLPSQPLGVYFLAGVSLAF